VIGINQSFVLGQKQWLTEALGRSWELNLHFLVLTDDTGAYYGSIWVFTRPDYPYIGMYGIKGSLIDVVTQKRLSDYAGVSKQLIATIENMGRSRGLSEIIVVNPLPGMRPILDRYGFEAYEDDDDNSPVRQFIQPISSSYDFYARDIV